jgi:hypothetical protein
MAKKTASKSSAIPAPDAAPAAPKAKATKPRATSVPRAKTEKAVGANLETQAVPSMPQHPLLVTEQAIAERAYEKFCKGEPGDHFAHWCAAERELREQNG